MSHLLTDPTCEYNSIDHPGYILYLGQKKNGFKWVIGKQGTMTIYHS